MDEIKVKNIIYFSFAFCIIISINLIILFMGSLFPSVPFTDSLTIFEVNLWYFVVIFAYCMMVVFYMKNKKNSDNSSPFLLGIALFSMVYATARFIENIRRYFIGTYNDVFEYWKSGRQITGLNFYLRLSYYVIAWIGIALFYLKVEKNIIGTKRHFLTYFAILEGFLSILNYFILNLTLFILTVFFYYVAATFPSVILLYLGLKAPKGIIKKGLMLASFGLILFVTGVALDLPETSYFSYVFALAQSEIFMRLLSPLLVLVGIALFLLGFNYISGTENRLNKVQEEIKETNLADTDLEIFKKMGINLVRPDDLTEEEIAFYREQTQCIVCKKQLIGSINLYICPKCRTLYCDKCSEALSNLENLCWSCNNTIDETRPSKTLKIKKAEKDPNLEIPSKKKQCSNNY
ncbi:MAG: hypothetical protein ACTSR8_11660 [Promethearchaeota archaeon]